MVSPEISVIIPTYNRCDTLSRTLTALCETQVGVLPSWEVIVVDDGSTDDTLGLLNRLSDRYAQLIFLTQPNQKQGAARNAAMKLARGELFVFLGDDIIPEPAFLAAHWQRYVAAGRSHTYAAIGRTSWHPDIKITPFRNWINEWGLQFGFQLISDVEHVPFNFFYTSNLAFSRALYDSQGGFDESFREYGWEDIELGYRYEKKGMILRYETKAAAGHLHPITLTSFCLRQFKVGYSSVLFHKMHPELSSFLHICDIRPELLMLKPFLWVSKYILRFIDEFIHANICHLHEILLKNYYMLGMLKAQQESKRLNATDGDV
jgi:glycosyltransferase involved in cell wall biosynthesis